MGLFSRKKEVVVPEIIDDTEDNEIIAVIMAAISAYSADQYVRTLSIRKIDRTAGTRPAWGVTGMMEAIDERRI